MATSADALRALLAVYLGPAVNAMRLTPMAPEGREERFEARGPSGVLQAHLYPPSEREMARREEAGLRLGGAMGLAPELIAAGEHPQQPGGWIILVQSPNGDPLGGRPLTDAESAQWLFLLLTLHHLRPDMAAQPSSMSADLSAWWARLQPAWESVRSGYAEPRHAPLLQTLGQLHAITQVRIETNRALWVDVIRRPCHGNPAPGRLVSEDRRLRLTEWSGFGLGDPAVETARVSVLATLMGELAPQQYERFVSHYLDGMRDLRDATLEERFRLFASVAPMGFTLSALAALAQPGALPANARPGIVAQLGRALTWSQRALGVAFGEPAALLAPLS